MKLLCPERQPPEHGSRLWKSLFERCRLAVQRVFIETEHIKLDSFLKWAGIVATGGQARALLRENRVRVNGEPEERRGRKLRPGDEVHVQGAGTFRLEPGKGNQ